MSTFEINDIKIVPDIIHTYTSDLLTSKIPIVIDNGSYQCRAGWATIEQPALIFKNIIAKPRKDRGKKENFESNGGPNSLVGNDIVNIETLRFQLRTQFDRNVVTHFHIQEQIFDYIFSHLGINTTEAIHHPILITECFANPNYSRNLMSELLFECYDVPGVCYGVDSLFGFSNYAKPDTGLIISGGFQSTYIIPVIDGSVKAEHARRINIGGYHMTYFLHRLLQLKYPVHVNAITLSRAEKLLHEHCSFAYNYMDELKNWSTLEFYEQNVKKIQLPFTQLPIVPSNTQEQKTERRRESARRLIEINNRKREEKLAEDIAMLQRLFIAQSQYENGHMEEFEFTLKEYDLSNLSDLEKMVTVLKARIDKTKAKITTSADCSAIQSSSEDKFVKVHSPPDGLTIEEWIQQVKEKKSSILEKKLQRRQRKQDLAKRRTAAAQERMRIISHLARKEKGNDEFGQKDEDWDIYKTISKEGGDSDSEAENDKIFEIDEILRQHDPSFEEVEVVQGTAESYQLHIGVESIRAPELLFQPSMIGCSEGGLMETLLRVLKCFPADTQNTLANNIYLNGGIAQFPGLQSRLSRELTENLPHKSTHHIKVSSTSINSWMGARSFATSNNFSKSLLTKENYIEMGPEYLKEHYASNVYFSTPTMYYDN